MNKLTVNKNIVVTADNIEELKRFMQEYAGFVTSWRVEAADGKECGSIHPVNAICDFWEVFGEVVA